MSFEIGEGLDLPSLSGATYNTRDAMPQPPGAGTGLCWQPAGSGETVLQAQERHCVNNPDEPDSKFLPRAWGVMRPQRHCDFSLVNSKQRMHSNRAVPRLLTTVR